MIPCSKSSSQPGQKRSSVNLLLNTQKHLCQINRIRNVATKETIPQNAHITFFFKFNMILMMESDFIHLCYHLLFFFLQGIQMSPKKRAELNLKGSAHSCEKDLAVVSGSYFNTNTGLFRRAEGGFQAVADARRSCSTSQTEKPGKNQARVSSMRDGFTRPML